MTRSTLSLVVLATLSLSASAAPLQFELKFTEAVSKEPFTGRVFVLCSRTPIRGLAGGVNWFRPEPLFAKDVENWKPGDPLVFDKDVLGYPFSLEKLPEARYHIQAVMDFDNGGRRFTRSPGNTYSKSFRQELSKSSGVVRITIDQVYEQPKFRETEKVKLVDIPSAILTKFHAEPIRMQAGVALPRSFGSDPDRRYPIIYEIPGFGGTHTAIHGRSRNTNVDGVEFLYVMLNPECRLGHHVFADSENNGPWGKALTEELIPAIEKRFKAFGTPATRFVTGHSSGGWSSLWLQVAYPDFFGGVWSTAPDPVDFRDFQRIDIYDKTHNMFVDADGKKRPIARRGEDPILFYKQFSDMEVVLGRGGQLGSFEAVFSPKGDDGEPLRLWDRKTGTIDPKVAKAWEKYDIRLVLQRNWKQLAPKLSGKIHVYMGELDTFYLEGAVRLLKLEMEKLKSDAVIELFPKKNHGTLMSSALRKRIAKEMADQFRQSQRGASSP